MDQTKFLQACAAELAEERQKKGIGTLGEKGLHAVLKRYLESQEENREVSVGPYVADIQRENEIVEIQTGNFNKLRNKLEYFLSKTSVTIAYPVAAVKWLIWVEEDGAASPKRKSPKCAGPWEILPELYKIKPLLLQTNLCFCIFLLEMEEYRLKNGWGKDGKQGSTRVDRLPVRLVDELWIRGLSDYKALIPPKLGEEFTVSDFSQASRLSAKKASVAVNVLNYVGVLERMGKKGRAYLYRRR